MKKYLMVTSGLNIVMALLISKILIGYLNLSITNHYNGYVDTICLLLSVFISFGVNLICYKAMKVNGKKIYITIPTIIFMFATSLLLFASR